MKKITAILFMFISVTICMSANYTRTINCKQKGKTTRNVNPKRTEAAFLSDLIISEIFSGQAGADLTADWFEIKNNGTTAWISGVDPDLYYDDEYHQDHESCSYTYEYCYRY